MASLRERSTHFEFGQNWRDYAKSIDRLRIEAAIEGLQKLFPDGGLTGKTFLDIGCGSGVHALAALSLGAASVTAVDIDENSVSTTRDTLGRFSPSTNWTARVASVFDMTPENFGTFDVVYSWGVLHHTGDMWTAIERAATLVKPGGSFALAIYSATTMDPLWKIEKKLYARKLPASLQWIVRQMYIAAFLAGKTVTGTNPVSYVRNYTRLRGMNFSHDAHDWLGGYPYESASASELRDRICSMGFTERRAFLFAGDKFGLFGSGCHELVFSKS
jgi:2-polyprenyl-6-hydroxyphenyl methylase/3-demethylubiquinone-9 3-methyltransferase